MNKRLNLSILIIIAFLSSIIAQSPEANRPTIHFENVFLSFDYPSNWTVVQQEGELSQVTLTSPKSAAEIWISVERPTEPGCDYDAGKKRIKQTLIEKVDAQIGSTTSSPAPVNVEIDGLQVEGVKLQGHAKRRQMTGEIYVTRSHLSYLSLAFIRTADDPDANRAWTILRSSLKVETPVLAATTKDSDGTPLKSSTLNGRALQLPPPRYPAIARQGHAQGVVRVQVVISEDGSVIAAHAIDGHPLLQSVSEEAARQAHFSPMLMCGEPVRVTGVITYNFVSH